MHMAELLPELSRHSDVSIEGLTDDSREVRPGDLFLAVAGHETDGRNFIKNAIERGARLVVAQSPFDSTGYENVVVIPDLDRRRGEIAARYHGYPSREMLVCAVTGTNGKSSVTHYVAQLLNALSCRCGVVGTLGAGMDDALVDLGVTTPSALVLQKVLSELKDKEVEAVCIEASSHGLDQGRLTGCEVDVAVLTNISQDHLDYHGNFDAYRRAKFSLFELPSVKHWVINADDPSGRELIKTASHPVNIVSYSIGQDTDADICVERSVFHEGGIEAEIRSPWGGLSLTLGLLGRFNLSNVLASVGVLGSLGYSMAGIQRASSQLIPVTGRMQLFRFGNGLTVVVDYAHTPDALGQALEAVKQHVPGRLVCVFGCGGDRDVDKRPMMGQVAARYAEHIVLADDNPRTESSHQIIAAIRKGIPEDQSVDVIADRKTAITQAIKSASDGDVVLIAGKGHEEYQVVNGLKQHHSDISSVQAMME